jgi:hypothetical protein
MLLPWVQDCFTIFITIGIFVGLVAIGRIENLLRDILFELKNQGRD